MQTKVQKWGNSLAIRIPRAYAEQTGIAQDTAVELSVQGSDLIVKPVLRLRPRLQDLLDQITDENRHEETDFGPPVGREIW